MATGDKGKPNPNYDSIPHATNQDWVHQTSLTDLQANLDLSSISNVSCSLKLYHIEVEIPVNDIE